MRSSCTCRCANWVWNAAAPAIAIAFFSLVIWSTLDARVVTSPATDEITLENRMGALIERGPELLAVRVVS